MEKPNLPRGLLMEKTNLPRGLLMKEDKTFTSSAKMKEDKTFTPSAKEISKDIYDNKYTKLNIHQKVLLVRRSLSYMQKDTEGFGYKYTKESAILSAIKPMMDKVGLNLDMEAERVEDVGVAVYVKNEKKYINVSGIRIYFTFTFTNADNPVETIIKKKIVQDAGSDIKTIGALETYANRYFLTKFFLIPNDKADPDAHEKSLETATSKSLTSNQILEVKEWVNNDIVAWKMIHNTFGYSKFSEISQNKLDEIRKMLTLYNLKKEKGTK